MTLSKLSLRNAQRQARDYLVYFVTVVIAAALIYAFNGLVFSREMQSLSQMMRQLPLVVVLASAVVVCIFGWLVSYSTRFMLSRRSRELGTYILIGLTNDQVARMFFLENLAVGGVALILGTALGGLLYQILRAIVMALFGLPYHFSLSFSFPAIGLTAAYFVLIYFFALLKNRKRIRKMKIYDLIYFEKQNEDALIRTGKKRRFIFTVSILLGVIGTFLIMVKNLSIALIGAGLIILFLFGFFLCFASGVPAFFDRQPAKKYQGQNLLVFRTLTAKLATMGIVMAVISLIFTVTLITEGSGFVIHGILKGRADENACFDLYLGVEGDKPGLGPYLDFITENIPVEQSVFYQVYQSGNSQVMDYVSERTVYYNYGYKKDPILRFSDYAALRAIAGYPAVELAEGQYLIHCIAYLEEVLRNYTQTLTLGNTTLTCGGVHTEHLAQGIGVGNGRGYILVVPDEAAEDLRAEHPAYAAKTLEPVTEEQYYTLSVIADREYDIHQEPSYYAFFTTKANLRAEVAAQTAVLVFPMFYLVLALTMTSAAILTIQQLSETERYKRQFALLRKLGMARREMIRALRNQFAIYYTMPTVPSLLISIPFILDLVQTPEPGVLVGMSSPAAIITISLGMFFLIYAVYILLAYTSLKRNVLPN